MGVGLVALGPGRFYGSALPRPRFFTDVKLNDERVDPPPPVMEPFLSWANEAHWSMGGLSFKRCRLQGRIEGSIKKLREQHDRLDRKKRVIKIRISGVKPASLKSLDSASPGSSEEIVVETAAVVQPNPPKKKRARKLIDEFEMVAAEEKSQTSSAVVNPIVREDSPTKKVKKADAVDLVASRTRSRKLSVGKEEEVRAAVASPVHSGKLSVGKEEEVRAAVASPVRSGKLSVGKKEEVRAAVASPVRSGKLSVGKKGEVRAAVASPFSRRISPRNAFAK